MDECTGSRRIGPREREAEHPAPQVTRPSGTGRAPGWPWCRLTVSGREVRDLADSSGTHRSTVGRHDDLIRSDLRGSPYFEARLARSPIVQMSQPVGYG